MGIIKIRPNLQLLTAIRAAGLRQREFAKRVGDHECFVSQVVNGHRNLDEGRQELYARILGCKPEELFQ